MLNIFQKCTSAIRQLAYASTADQLDEYLEMGSQTSSDSLNYFCKCVVQLYHSEFLRKPTQEDVNRVTAKHEAVHGFPGMLGSVDCMHWAWRNCPTAWQGQYTRGDKGHPTIMLEAVASFDLWIWHAYFGPAGSNNDINVFIESDLFGQLLQDKAPAVDFTVNGQQFTKGYYLADSMYPEWATLVMSFKCPMDPKTSKFKRFQESARKDVERALGVLQGRWRILQQGARPLSINKIKRIMYFCVLLHNMVVEYNGRAISPLDLELIPDTSPTCSWDERVDIHLRMTRELCDRATHNRLRGALVEHISNLPENQRER
uniref:protein ALP1-like n=1 Tax=Erigeron canadensis TaxID=72917 RepID=UPI001CB90249|nr:protein ALP1-like [Erigeron canadensis]